MKMTIQTSETMQFSQTSERNSTSTAVPCAEVCKFYSPPLAEQQRIVAILDRFDTLVHDLTHGLPAEIAARRKQGERALFYQKATQFLTNHIAVFKSCFV